MAKFTTFESAWQYALTVGGDVRQMNYIWIVLLP